MNEPSRMVARLTSIWFYVESGDVMVCDFFVGLKGKQTGNRRKKKEGLGKKLTGIPLPYLSIKCLLGSIIPSSSHNIFLYVDFAVHPPSGHQASRICHLHHVQNVGIDFPLRRLCRVSDRGDFLSFDWLILRWLAKLKIQKIT